jgi:hypothetical protein
MLGDQLGIPAIAFGTPRPFPPAVPAPVRSQAVVPSVRGFKISEDDSPRPRDRVYYGFNFFDDVNGAVNRALGSEISFLRAYRETLGLEKTFLDGNASVGLRMFLNTLDADSPRPDLNGSSTALGDLTVITKYALINDRDSGTVLSFGLAVTAPTGPSTFAGSNAISAPFHSTILQPYIGYIWYPTERVYIHGFSAMDIPTDTNDVTFVTNDIGIGYYLYRNPGSCRWLTEVVPTFEVHITDPVNHQGALTLTDPVGTPDVVNLTMGTTFGLWRRSTLSVGLVTPVTGPRPFDYEVLVQYNYNFGTLRGGPGAAGGPGAPGS